MQRIWYENSYFIFPPSWYRIFFSQRGSAELVDKETGERYTERRKVQRQRGSGRAGRTESLEAGQGEAAEHGGWSQETGCWHCPSSSSVAARAAFFHVFYLLSFACFVRTAATNRVRQAGRLRHAATPDRAASGRHYGDHSGIKQAGEGDPGCQPAAPVPAEGGGGLRRGRRRRAASRFAAPTAVTVARPSGQAGRGDFAG